MCLMLKTIGVFLVVAGAGGCGWVLARSAGKRIEILQELLQALILLHGDIAYSVGDMSENMERLSCRTEYFSAFFQEISERLSQKRGQSLYHIWREELKQLSCRQLLHREDMEFLKEIGQNLGNLDRQTQLNTLQVMRERLQQNIDAARQEYRSQAKLFRVVGLTVGIFTAVLLV